MTPVRSVPPPPVAEESGSTFAAVLGMLPPQARILVLGVALGGGLLAWLDRRIDAHTAPIAAAVEQVGAGVRDLAKEVRATQAASDRRIDAQDVQIAGIRATIDADESQPSYAGRGRP